jgi:mRNA deadenylase 3'-5' endonuclease subunit Ccr4
VAGKEPAFTNYTADFVGTIDYVSIGCYYKVGVESPIRSLCSCLPGKIWFTSDSLQALSVLDVPSESSLKPHYVSPNAQFPSDHMSLKATFQVL